MREIVKNHLAKLYPQYENDLPSYPINKDEAYPVVDQFFFGYFNKGEISCWSREDRFSKTVETKQKFDPVLNNANSNGYIAVSRKFEPQCDGKITLQTVIDLKNARNGARFYLDNTDAEKVFEVFSKDGLFFIQTDSVYPTSVSVHDGYTYFKADFDLDTRKCTAYIDGVFACNFQLGENYKNFGKITVSTSENCPDLSMQMRRMYIRRNYAVDENFYAPVYPCDWEECPEAKMIRVYNDAYESGTLKLDTSTTAKKIHRPLNGKIVFESFFYLPEKGDEYKIHFDDALTVTVKDGEVNVGGISHRFIPHIWQNVRIVADTDKKEAEIYICGKIKGSVAFGADSVDNVCFEFIKGSENGYVLIDDVRVYNIFDYPDYCPEPVVPKSRGMNVIMSVCSLWHEGSHHGYDYVAPFDETTPMLGYYDEGNPECADWETKYMLEQGVSAFQYCWYPPQYNPEIPIKTPRAFWHQYEGYFYGKYSHMLPFCIMWENAGAGSHSFNLEQFKTFFWDYWVEWCFRDPRYYRIDNKAVLHIYKHDLFIKTFGSVENAREILAFMREDIKKYGYDGIILLVNCGNAYDDKLAKHLEDMGFDGLCNYALGKASYEPEFINKAVERFVNTFTRINSNMYVVPTVGTGWNILGWEDTRTPLSTPDQYAQSIKYGMEISKNQKNCPNIMYFSTWNEYGEGHWLAPSGLNGFGYSDAMRSVLCEETDIRHVTPTAGQMARIAHLHNDYRTPIRSWHYEHPDPAKLDTETVYSFDMSLDAWEFEDVKVSKGDDGAIIMDGYDIDPKCIYKKELGVRAADVDYIHLRMSTDSYDVIQFFFTTDEKPNFFATGYMAVVPAVRGEYYDIYIETKHLDWKGIIGNIRIDTAESPSLAKILKVELLKIKPVAYDFGLVVDGTALNIPFHYKSIEDGEYYTAANPKNGIFAATNIFHEWDRFEGKLYLKTSTGTEFLFTVGSDKVSVDGKEFTLKKPFALFDHIPVLPLTFIFDKARLTYSVKDNTIFLKVRD